MVLPNFLIIGTQKSGTSWLSAVLEQHPEIFLPKDVEIHFFTGKHRGDLDWYEQYFTQARSEIAIGEKSTSYLWTTRHPDIAQRIHAFNPQVKLIAMLRDPVYRMISAFGHNWRTGKIPVSCHIDDLIAGKHDDLVKQYGLIDIGLYYRHLKPFFDVFAPEQIEVLIYEEDVSFWGCAQTLNLKR
jgi:Sulfotransferase domain